jgi:hypothetical protein
MIAFVSIPSVAFVSVALALLVSSFVPLPFALTPSIVILSLALMPLFGISLTTAGAGAAAALSLEQRCQGLNLPCQPR